MAKLSSGAKLERLKKGSEYQRAANLFARFTGHDAEPVATVAPPKIPKVAAVIGTLDGVLYTTVRDNVKEKYIHKFRAKDKPLLCVTPEGQLLMIGGNYDFTERGIVDASDTRNR